MKYSQILPCLTLAIYMYPILTSADTGIGRMNVDHYCAFKRELPPSQITYFDADPAAISTVRRIMKMVGLAHHIEVRAADVYNAAAVIHNNKRFILYNPDFMETVNNTNGSNWPEISILAHEIAHHLNNHTLENDGSRPKTELEADQFSGFVLQKMGATLEQAKLAMQELADEKPTATHPGKRTRIIAIASGWRNARHNNVTAQRLIKNPQLIPIPINARSAPLHQHGSRSHSHPLPSEGLSHQHQQQDHKNNSAPVSNQTVEKNIHSFVFGNEQQIADQILRVYGMSLKNANFQVKASLGARVPNAASVIQNGSRYVLYNQKFMTNINQKTGTKWAGVAVFAHEIAHHLLVHSLQNSFRNRKNDELTADYWAGSTLRRLGASLTETTAIYKTMPDIESSTHPSRKERIDSVTNGWMAASKKSPQ